MTLEKINFLGVGKINTHFYYIITPFHFQNNKQNHLAI